MTKALLNTSAGLILGTDMNFVSEFPGFSAHRELQFFVEAGLTPY